MHFQLKKPMSLLWVSISTISLTNSAYRFYQFCYTQTLIRLGMGIDYHYHYPCCTEDHRFDFSLGWSRTRIWRTFQGGREPKRAIWGRLGREGAACKCGLVLKKTCFCPTKSAWQSLLEPNISGCVSCDVRLSWRAGQHLFKDGEQECALGMKSGHSVQLLHPNLPRALVQLLSEGFELGVAPSQDSSDHQCFAHPAPCWCAMSTVKKVVSPAWSGRNTLHQNGGADSVSSQKVQVEICKQGIPFVPITSKWLGLPSPTSPETPFGFALTRVKSRHLRHVRDKVPKDKSVTGMPIPLKAKCYVACSRSIAIMTSPRTPLLSDRWEPFASLRDIAPLIGLCNHVLFHSLGDHHSTLEFFLSLSWLSLAPGPRIGIYICICR